MRLLQTAKLIRRILRNVIPNPQGLISVLSGKSGALWLEREP